MKRLLTVVGIAGAVLMLGAGSAWAALGPGEVLVANFGVDALVRVDPVTGKQSRFGGNELAANSANPLLAEPTDVMVSPTGRIFVVDNSAFGGDGGVIEIDPDTGAQTKISANDQPVNASSQLFGDPNGIAITSAGQLLVSDRAGDGTVISVDPSTGKETLLSSNDQPVNASSQFFADLRGGITVARSGAVLVANGGGDPEGIISVNPVTGKQTILSSNDQPGNTSSQFFETPVGIKETPSGQLVVADQSVGVIGVNPATGKQTKVSANDQPVNASSQFFNDAFHLAFALNGRILVADIGAFGDAGCGDSEGCGGVISVDPATGKQTVFSSNNQPVNATSQLYDSASGIAVMPPRCRGRLATVYGTPGPDTIKGTVGADVIAAQAGKDTVSGVQGNDIVCAGGGNDTVRGGAGKDTLLGDAGRDRLVGGKGRDTLVGGKGRDRLRGGPGRDVLRGGPGRDRQRQ